MPSLRMNLLAVVLLVSAGIFGVANHYHSVPAPATDVDVLDGAHRRLVSEGERPIIYTYHEQPSVYNPNDDTLDLIDNWRKSWYDMGKKQNRTALALCI